MKGYLLDTNTVSRWLSGNANIEAHVKIASDNSAHLFVSVITIGEFNFGHELNMPTDPARRAEFIREVKERFPMPIEVTRFTPTYYGEMRAKVFQKFPPKSAKQNHLERCVDWVSGDELGIEENDMWIAAQAVERGLVVVSNDKMKKIQEAVGPVLELEDWEKPI